MSLSTSKCFLNTARDGDSTTSPGSLFRSLYGLSTPRQTDTSSQSGIICKLTEGALDPTFYVIAKVIKDDQSQDRPLRDTTCQWPPSAQRAIDPLGTIISIQILIHRIVHLYCSGFKLKLLKNHGAIFIIICICKRERYVCTFLSLKKQTKIYPTQIHVTKCSSP